MFILGQCVFLKTCDQSSLTTFRVNKYVFHKGNCLECLGHTKVNLINGDCCVYQMCPFMHLLCVACREDLRPPQCAHVSPCVDVSLSLVGPLERCLMDLLKDYICSGICSETDTQNTKSRTQ